MIVRLGYVAISNTINYTSSSPYTYSEYLNKNNILFSFTFDGVFYFCLIHLIYIKLYKCV